MTTAIDQSTAATITSITSQTLTSAKTAYLSITPTSIPTQVSTTIMTRKTHISTAGNDFLTTAIPIITDSSDANAMVTVTDFGGVSTEAKTTRYNHVNATTTQSTTSKRSPYTCPNTSYIGTYCNISADPCELLQPCQNSGTCILNSTLSQGYSCQCQVGYEGHYCDYDKRVCKESTCW